MIDKFKKYFFPLPPIFLVGAIINPCMKYNTMSEFTSLIYSALGVKADEEPSLYTSMSDANSYMNTLYNHYADLLDNALPSHITPTPAPHPSEEPSSSKRQAHNMPVYCVSDLSVWNRLQPSSHRTVSREELKYYLMQPTEDPRGRINTLEWWKNNERQYPVLSMLARDILNVPMSTVASESAFSQGRQQIGDNRHTLGGNAMNVLVCLRDWIRAERRNQGMFVEPEDEEDLEEIMTSRENSAQSSPMHGFGAIDFDNAQSILVNVNMGELEKKMKNL